jgi:hypothetical protein
MTKPIVWSYGGGTQSVAIAVLIADGTLPKPERVVIADTGREATETWEYTRDVVDPLLATVGLEVEVAPSGLATVGLYAKNGDLLIPAFTTTGKLPTLCSNEWKKRVISRWCRGEGYGPKNPVRMWLGISVDEVHRAKPSGVGWLEYHWPLLLDTPRRRDECIALVIGAGLPDPPRSACWMCPHRNNTEWRRLRDHFPDDWERAQQLEASIQSNDERDGGLYLHRQLVDIGAAEIDEENLDLFDECDSGFCFT